MKKSEQQNQGSSKSISFSPLRLSQLDKKDKTVETEKISGIILPTKFSELSKNELAPVSEDNTIILPTEPTKKEKSKDLQSILESLSPGLHEKIKKINPPRKPSEVTKGIKSGSFLKPTNSTNNASTAATGGGGGGGNQTTAPRISGDETITKPPTDYSTGSESIPVMCINTTSGDTMAAESKLLINSDEKLIDAETMSSLDSESDLSKLYAHSTNYTCNEKEKEASVYLEDKSYISPASSRLEEELQSVPSTTTTTTTSEVVVEMEEDSSITQLLAAIGIVVLVVIIYFASQISSYLVGFLCGLPTGLLIYHAYSILMTRKNPENHTNFHHEFPKSTSTEPSQLVPEFVADDCSDGSSVHLLTTTMSRSRSMSNQDQVFVHQTWMHELCNYSSSGQDNSGNGGGVGSNNSSASAGAGAGGGGGGGGNSGGTAIPVYITLEGTSLRLQRTRQEVNRRVLYNDKSPLPHFHHSRIFNLLHAQVTLKPDNISQKRQWNHKYPICIQLSQENNDNVNFYNSSQIGIGGNNSSPRGPTLLRKMMVRNRFLKKDIPPPPLPSSSSSSSSPSSSQHHRDTTTIVGGINNSDNVEDIFNEEDFELVSEQDVADSLTLYLLTRTCREKEHWYRLLQNAAMGRPLITSISHIVNKLLSDKGSNTLLSDPETLSLLDPINNGKSKSTNQNGIGIVKSPRIVSANVHCLYVQHMAKFMPGESFTNQTIIDRNYIPCEPQYVWINAFIGRLVWDFLREPFWAAKVKALIQTKLKKLPLPQFISEITVLDIDLGKEFPHIQRTKRTYLDGFGLWIDMDIAYAGGFSMTLSTKVNPLKMAAATTIGRGAQTTTSGGGSDEVDQIRPRDDSTPSDFLDSQESESSSKKYNDQRTGANSDKEDTDDASSVDGSVSSQPVEEELNEPQGKGKLWNFVGRVTKSQLFSKAMGNKYVKRGMEAVGRTNLDLQVEVNRLSGTLCLNIPPPPSDRLWFGFRENPQLKISARPKVGDRNITMPRILEWIENRIIIEIQRLLVYPNMDDLPIPLLLDNNPKYFGHNQ